MKRSEEGYEEKTLDRILSFTKEEQEAYRMVLVFLCAVGHVLNAKGASMPHLGAQEMHKTFEVFVRELGLSGKLYESVGGKIPAVTLYLHDDNPGSESRFWFITPQAHAFKAPWRASDRRSNSKVMLAAVEACKIWLPDWGWSEELVLKG